MLPYRNLIFSFAFFNYRKVASTNASRFEAHLVYMHTQNDNFLIRSPSQL